MSYMKDLPTGKTLVPIGWELRVNDETNKIQIIY